MQELQRISKIKEIVKNIPTNPGIYMMKDENQNIIYVGKAISLKKRVSQYFRKSVKSSRIEKMASLVHDISYIVTNNEVEALILECNYIKSHDPKFNIMLKDDKTYPYIKINVNDKYPMVTITRTKKDDKSVYFGPYANVGAIRDMLSIIRQIFPIKRCKYNLEKTKVKPCLYYHINRCLGPCINDLSVVEYKKMIDQIILFLQGKTKEIEEQIKKEIDKCIEVLDFEKAGRLKLRLDNIEKVKQKQTVANLNEINTDIIGYVHSENILNVEIFKIRNYKIVLNETIKLKDVESVEIEEILSQVTSQYYMNNEDVPKKVYIKLESEDTLKVIQEYLSNIKGSKVEVITPKKGEKLKLIQMVENNINVNLEKSKSNVIEDLRLKLNFQGSLDSIECYDISNLKDEYIVGGMIRFESGKLNKKMYRKFKIKSTLTQNDPKCIYEILLRRLNHSKDWVLPDIILIDGGKTQVNAAKQALKESGENIKIYGMIKNDKHRTRGLIDEDFNEIDLEESSNMPENKRILNFITFLQDEVHRFAITYHRKLRDTLK